MSPETVEQIPDVVIRGLLADAMSDGPMPTDPVNRRTIIALCNAYLDRSRRPSSEAGQALVGVPFVTADLMVAGRIDGMGNPDPQGSYLWFILDRKDGAPTHYKISEGAADLAASTIRTALQPGHKP